MKRFISILLATIIVFSFNNNIVANEINEVTEITADSSSSNTTCQATLDDDFADDCVI